MLFLLECLIALLLVIASAFILIGAIGIVRLPDLYMRLHATSTTATLGLGSILIASMLFALTLGKIGFTEVLISFLVFINAPVSANLLAQAAIHLKLRSLSGEVPEALNRRLPWDKHIEED